MNDYGKNVWDQTHGRVIRRVGDQINALMGTEAWGAIMASLTDPISLITDRVSLSAWDLTTGALL
jgi:hypothetical protein